MWVVKENALHLAVYVARKATRVMDALKERKTSRGPEEQMPPNLNMMNQMTMVTRHLRTNG